MVVDGVITISEDDSDVAEEEGTFEGEVEVVNVVPNELRISDDSCDDVLDEVESEELESVAEYLVPIVQLSLRVS